jgi:F-type H+-transporting ATPase subunit b
MISVNATLLVQVCLFLIFLCIFNRIMIQPMHRIILERERHLQQKKNELAAVQEEIRQLGEDYEARLRQAEREARESQLALKEKAGEEARQLVMTAKEQGTALQEKVRSEVDRELSRAREKVAEQAELLSLSVTQKVLGRGI